LLDLTIKHMVFMQSLAKYAERLKQPYESKVMNQIYPFSKYTSV